ncbi:hypothetical protein GCM10017783_05140 [Deinococcus piscis]|uniref:Nudix hydrolase domain-containing protein n=1 Tax=Deinococcus piscis TaxID=394230 RepID=A0ABQ3K1R5_9DEIO|nr:NUDIX hydrolase [Deinococcus piscis]GHF96246.1 hypothetical protein GCM10017783_05140 [Deinococcus piscis]
MGDSLADAVRADKLTGMRATPLAQDGEIIFWDVLCAPETEAARYQPLTHAVVGVRHGEDLLMLKAVRKGTWEFAGGFIDAGETPREAAGRELYGETGQLSGELRYVGVMHYDLGTLNIAGQTGEVYGALYLTEAESRSVTVQQAEHDAFRWLAAGAPLDEFDPFTAALVRVMRGA